MKKVLIILLIMFSMFTVGCKDLNIGDSSKDNSGQVAENDETENQDDKDSEENKEDQGEKDETIKEEVAVSKYKISDFVGIKANEKYLYAGENSEFAEYIRYVEYIDGDKFQIRTNNSATETVKVIQVTDNELKVIFKRGVCDYRENFLNKPASQTEILLKGPLSKGTEWNLEDGSRRYISAIDAKVSTKAGEYECIEVTTERKNGEKDLHYYAPNIGLVKEIYDVGNMGVTSVLDVIEKDVRLTQVIRFYEPDEQGNYMKYEDVEVSFATNDITRLTLESKFREYGLLKEKVGINSLYLNDDGMLYLDLTKSFIPEMANGTTGEYFAIQDLVNTLGGYYGVDKVYITLDGTLYESGHISKEKGESFKVDLSKVK